jgi:hypothetical protein
MACMHADPGGTKTTDPDPEHCRKKRFFLVSTGQQVKADLMSFLVDFSLQLGQAAPVPFSHRSMQT